MALGQTLELLSTVQLGTTNIAIIWQTGAPDGDAAPEQDALKGSLYIRTDATDDESPLFLKIDENGSDDDWVAVFIDKAQDSGGLSLLTYLEMATDNKIRFRSSSNFIHSTGVGEILIQASGTVTIGDGTNASVFTDGTLTMEGSATITPPSIPLPIALGGGDAEILSFNGAPSIDLDTDGDVVYASFDVPNNWDADTDMTLVLMVGNEIAEDDGDDVSITCQVRGYADGDTMSDAGQTVACTLNLTGGDEAINVVNRVTGTIDYDEATYPIAAGDTVVIKAAVNLGGAGECTGPLHVVAWWVEYTADRLGD